MKKTTIALLSLLVLNFQSIAQEKESKKQEKIQDDNYDNEEDDEKKSPRSSHPFYKKSYQARNSGSFHKRSNLLSLGYGYNVVQTTDVIDDVYTLKYPIEKMGGYYLRYEAAVAPTLGLSFNLGYANKKNSDVKLYDANENVIGTINDFDERASYYAGAVLLNYHFNKIIPSKKVDLYVGAGVGLRYFRFNYNSKYENLPIGYGVAVFSDYIPNGYNTTKVTIAARAGVRYYISPVIGLNIDYGYDRFTYGNFGLTFNLNPYNKNKNYHSQGTAHGSNTLFNKDSQDNESEE